jgi:pimeloyl-ACP methyl ester carboxylesterase
MTMVFVGGALGSRTGIVGVYSHKYRVICVDIPGLGSLKGQPLTTDTACDHVKAVIDNHVKGKKAIVGGYSMGIFY